MAFSPINFVAVLSGVFLFSQASADTSARVYDDYPGNLFYAPYEVIPDHPDCGGPDEFAFRTTLSASDLGFLIYQPGSSDYFSVDRRGEVTVEPQYQCFRTERRGVDLMRFEVPCSDASVKRPAESIIEGQISLGLHGELTACVSMDGVRILDSSWRTVVELHAETTIHEGTFSAKDDRTSHPQRTYLRSRPFYISPGNDRFSDRYRDDIQPWATLYYNYEAVFGRQTNGAPPVGYEAAQFRATLSCIPISIPALNPDTLLIDAIVFFNLTKDDPQTCAAEMCEGLRPPPKTQSTGGFVRRCLIDN